MKKFIALFMAIMIPTAANALTEDAKIHNLNFETKGEYAIRENTWLADSVMLLDGSLVVGGERESKAYLAKYDIDGTLLWEKYLFHHLGNVRKMLYLSDGDFLVTGIDNGNGNGYSYISGAYIAKVNSDGEIVWSEKLKDNCCQFVGCLAELDPDTYAITKLGVGTDATLTVYNSDGEELFTKKYLYGSDYDYIKITSVAADEEGNIWVKIYDGRNKYPDIEVFDRKGKSLHKIYGDALPDSILKIDGDVVYGYEEGGTSFDENDNYIYPQGKIVKMHLNGLNKIIVEKTVELPLYQVKDVLITQDGNFILTGWHRHLWAEVYAYDHELNNLYKGTTYQIWDRHMDINGNVRIRELENGFLELRGGYTPYPSTTKYSVVTGNFLPKDNAVAGAAK